MKPPLSRHSEKMNKKSHSIDNQYNDHIDDNRYILSLHDSDIDGYGLFLSDIHNRFETKENYDVLLD